jgi:hypothetical protein
VSERATRCPQCERDGASVDRITLKALLTPDGLRRGIPAQPRFCETADCPIVYFDVDGDVTFTEVDLVVRVYAKHANDPGAPVCYCFGVDVATMRDASKARDSRESVAREVQAGHCACEVKNPKGGCCLGDLVRIEREQQGDVPVSSCCTVS